MAELANATFERQGGKAGEGRVPNTQQLDSANRSHSGLAAPSRRARSRQTSIPDEVRNGALPTLEVFGSVELRPVGCRAATPCGKKALAILVYLSVNCGHRVPRQRLVQLLWSRRWPEQGRASLRQCLRELKRACGSVAAAGLTINKEWVRLEKASLRMPGLEFRDERTWQIAEERAVRGGRFVESLRGRDPAFDSWAVEFESALGPSMTAAVDGDSRSVENSFAEPCPTLLAAGRQVLVEIAAPVSFGDAVSATPEMTGDHRAGPASARWSRFRWLEQGGLAAAGRPAVSEPRPANKCGVKLASRLTFKPAGPARSAPDEAGFGEFMDFNGNSQQALDLLQQACVASSRRLSGEPTAAVSILLAIQALADGSYTSWQRASLLLTRAVALNPSGTYGYSISALARCVGMMRGWLGRSDLEISIIDALCQRAVGCDTADSIACSTTGLAALVTRCDVGGARRALSDARHLNPDCLTVHWFSILLNAYQAGRTVQEPLGRLQHRAAENRRCFGLSGWFAVLKGYWVQDYNRVTSAALRAATVTPMDLTLVKLGVAAACCSGQYEMARHLDSRLRSQCPTVNWRAELSLFPFGRVLDWTAAGPGLARAGLFRADTGTESPPDHRIVPFRPRAAGAAPNE